MLRTLLPLAAIVAVAVAGCASQSTSNDSSGKFRGEQRLVANTIEDFESAASKGDQDQICRELLAQPARRPVHRARRHMRARASTAR